MGKIYDERPGKYCRTSMRKDARGNNYDPEKEESNPRPWRNIPPPKYVDIPKILNMGEGHKTVVVTGGRPDQDFYLNFRFDKELKELIKKKYNGRYHPDRNDAWSVPLKTEAYQICLEAVERNWKIDDRTDSLNFCSDWCKKPEKVLELPMEDALTLREIYWYPGLSKELNERIAPFVCTQEEIISSSETRVRNLFGKMVPIKMKTKTTIFPKLGVGEYVRRRCKLELENG